MAKTSKQKQAIRRAKRRATIAERYAVLITEVLPKQQDSLQTLNKENYMVKVLLFALLAQQGGSMEVTKGTFEQTILAFPRLSVSNSVKDGDEQTHVLTLVEAPEETSAQTVSEPALTIQHIADDPVVEEPFPGSTEQPMSGSV